MTLDELSLSKEILANRPARESPEYADTPWCLTRVGEKVIPFARVQLRGLGFEAPPTWGNVMRRVARRARLCTPDMHASLVPVMEGPADYFRMAMKPIGRERTIFICTGSHARGLIEVSVAPPYHRPDLDVEIVYPLR